ncbi:molybdopterin synthase sulfur carrier subunit [Mergibacter septicus]|uniref:Molybdopterin synthase sulfur carrier subunit n=1 Tax=Mergibacter septicus TaxID=221402 RepID=A0A8D4IXR3_9PAST|nr:molybdopterin synthase sulfur carrier subunit [Mergibacter septicus]AWX13350.1 molybdopterin synthase sulfur carrier subunit [Mergibacter septicus]AWX15296.1 molybdopterin synthase sulfur carrier subunit [Mergibacter septicus]QDJ14550.1 molybdopterin synthase sulfur carrier subunit [Mergibacter septicus]UTU48014.1 molybdopterin synthase sulfur carrier subunit [Mergibacter septicus]WMR96377.1 molybdopterin synthase sulfur carrier subunit [Mergibacter septicus]
MLTVLFFAQTRELIGLEQLEIENNYPTVEDLRQALIQRGDKWQLALEKGKLYVAVNQVLVDLNTALNDGDEVAFFPPVTGG